jgi:hypothetical protein
MCESRLADDTTKLPVSARCVGNFVRAVITRLVPFEVCPD